MGGEVALMMLSRAASSRARFRAAMQTRAPRFAAIDAIASPIPLLPPVTRTTLPCKDSAAGEQIEASPTRRAATRKIHVAFNANMMAKRAHGRSMTTPTRGVRGIMSMRKNNRLCASVVGSSGAFCLGVASSSASVCPCLCGAFHRSAVAGCSSSLALALFHDFRCLLGVGCCSGRLFAHTTTHARRRVNEAQTASYEFRSFDAARPFRA